MTVRKTLCILALCLAAPACANVQQRTFTYKNPVYSSAIDSIRDCQIIRADGVYYLMGTCPPYWKGPNPGIKIYSSRDLLTWKFERFLLRREDVPEDAWYRDRFWAPELHVVGGRYVLLFSARNEKKGLNFGCGVAVADNVLGPYTVVTKDKPLVANTIDLTLFADDDGKSYVYWRGVRGQEVDVKTWRLVGKPFECVAPEPGKWSSAGIEGPWVFKRAGTYYLLYSSWTRGYEIGYATAKDPRGPWKAWEGNPLLGAQNKAACAHWKVKYTGKPGSPYVGCGHGAIFTGPDGRDWLSCHYQEKGRPESLGFDPIWIENGVLRTNGPTHTEQTVTWTERRK